MERTLLISQQLTKLSLVKCESLKMEHESKLNSAKKEIPNSSTQIFCQKVLKHFPGSAKKEEGDVQSSSGVSFSEMMSEASKISQKISSNGIK